MTNAIRKCCKCHVEPVLDVMEREALRETDRGDLCVETIDLYYFRCPVCGFYALNSPSAVGALEWWNADRQDTTYDGLIPDPVYIGSSEATFHGSGCSLEDEPEFVEDKDLVERLYKIDGVEKE